MKIIVKILMTAFVLTMMPATYAVAQNNTGSAGHIETPRERKVRLERERKKKEAAEKKKREQEAAARRQREEEARKKREAEATAQRQREEETRKKREAEERSKRDNIIRIFNDGVGGEVVLQAQQVLKRKYNKTDVQTAVARLNSLKPVNEAQREEINRTIEQLGNYEPALRDFRELIIKLNGNGMGGPGYNNSDFSDDLAIFHAELVKKKVKDIPYLLESYETFIRELMANPQKHPAIEMEIMGE